MLPKKLIQSLLFILISLLISELSLPQNYLITKYSTENGLPDNRVNDIAQDSLGRIWIAMVSGIAMYDGYEWIKFGEKDNVPEIEYIRVKVDEKGVVWFLPVLTSNFPIVYYKNYTWEKIQFSNEQKKLNEALLSIEILYKKNKPIVFVGTISKGVFKYVDKNWSTINVLSGLIDNSISKIIKSKNKLFISTSNGLSIIDYNDKIVNFNFKNYDVNPRILSMIEFEPINSNEESLLLFGPDWIGKFDGKNLKKICSINDFLVLSVNDPHSINYTQQGDILFANSASVNSYNYEHNIFNKIFINDPAKNHGVNSIFIDTEKNIWLPSFRGLYKLTYTPFFSYTIKDGLLENEITAISGFNSGKLIFGHNMGISIKSRNKIKVINLPSRLKEHDKIYRILSIMHDQMYDRILFTSYGYGLGILSSDLNISWIKEDSSYRYYNVFNYRKDILISTNRFLAKLSKNNLVKFGLEIKVMCRLACTDLDTVLYLTTTNGILKISNGKLKKILPANFESDNMYGLLYSSNYGLLVGSAKGLFRLENDSLYRFNFDSQTISDPIYFIIQDSLKNIWLGTNNGVLKWDGKYLKRYNKNDGLAGNETNRAAGYVDNKGNVWIGTDEGVSMYTGEEIDYSRYTPKVLLLNFKDHSNRVYLLNENVNVDPDKNNLTFNYRGLSFIDEKRNTFQIKLASLDGDYQNEYVTKSTSARFNNLAPGNYVFSVRVQNAKGVWSDWKNSSIITIQKHFYNQPFFYGGAFILFIVFAYWINNFFQQKKYTRKLEEAVNLRTQDLIKTQNELITNVNRYKGIVESQTDLVVRVDKDGRFTFVNDAYCLVFGKKQDELIGNSFAPFIHPDDLEKTFAEMEKLKLPPYRVTIEQRALTEAGYRWFSWEDYAIRNHDGDIVEIQGVGRDITLQKEIEQELEKRVRERTIELESLVKQSPLGILIFNGDGKLLTFNKTAIEIFKLYEDVYNIYNDYNLFEDELLIKNNYKDKLDFIKTTNSSFSTEPMLVSNPESRIYKRVIDKSLLYRIYAIEFEDNHKNIVLLIDDITEQQNAEASNRKLNEEKIRVSTIINTIENERTRISKDLHDSIGQMLTAVKLKLEIINIKSSDYKSEISDSIELLLNAGDEIRRIINDLNPGDVKKLGLISAVELLLQRIKNYSNINLTFTHDTIGKINSEEKELLIYRIIQESLNNIIKHSNCNNAGVEFSSETNQILIKIWDDGVGCHEEELKNQDNKFGIANMYERVASLGGKIRIQTNVNKGFIILLNIPV